MRPRPSGCRSPPPPPAVAVVVVVAEYECIEAALTRHVDRVGIRGLYQPIVPTCVSSSARVTSAVVMVAVAAPDRCGLCASGRQADKCESGTGWPSFSDSIGVRPFCDPTVSLCRLLPLCCSCLVVCRLYVSLCSLLPLLLSPVLCSTFPPLLCPSRASATRSQTRSRRDASLRLVHSATHTYPAMLSRGRPRCASTRSSRARRRRRGSDSRRPCARSAPRASSLT
jgi:hypothetical protein